MVLLPRKPQKLAKTRTSILALERCQYVPRIYGRHHPKPAFTLDFDHIRSADQMAVAEPPILVFPLVAKNNTDTCTRPDGNSTKVGGDRHIKTLLLSFDDSLEIEVCVAFPVKIYIYSVEHHCAPVLFHKALSGIPHGTRRVGIVQDCW